MAWDMADLTSAARRADRLLPAWPGPARSLLEAERMSGFRHALRLGERRSWGRKPPIATSRNRSLSVGARPIRRLDCKSANRRLELIPASKLPIRSRHAEFREGSTARANRLAARIAVLPIMRLGDRASNVSRSLVGLTDRALCLTERALGDASRLTLMCVEPRIYLASSVG